MNPWPILNIQPTDDKKIIKKAYAVLIKQYKPDENPEKFQEIQVAYKTALSMRQWQIDEAETNYLPESLNNDLGESKTESFDLSETPVDEEQLKFDREQQKLIDNLYKKLHEMAFATLVVKDKLENWEFIEDFYKIDDLILKEEVARKFLEKVAEYNLFQMKETNTLQIKPRILVYMDSIFDWKIKGVDFSNHYRQDFFDVTFHYFDNKDIPNNYMSMLDSKLLCFQRLWTFTIDVIINIIMVFFFVTLTSIYFNFSSLSDFNIVLLFIIPFVLIRLLLEMFSKEKTSFGKKVTRRIILDKFGNLIDWKLALCRHVVLLFTLLPLLYLPMLGYEWSNIYILIWALFVTVVNLVCIFVNVGFLHDYLTKSMVYKIERHTIIV